MIKKVPSSFTILLLSLVAFVIQADEIIRIGTGNTVGVYYPTGGTICQILAAKHPDKENPPLCIAESTPGSSRNAISLAAKRLDYAILQEDILSDAYHGTGNKLKNNPLTNLRLLFRLYPETFTIITRSNAGIDDFLDLKGKEIAIGISGTGGYDNLRRYLKFQGLEMETFANFHYSAKEAIDKLCLGDLDAAIITIGHPSTFVRRGLDYCNGKLLNLSEKIVDKLVVNYPTYTRAEIYKNTYNNPETIRTFGTYAVLATYADQPDDEVYLITKLLFENLNRLQKGHPVIKRMAFGDMINERSTVPMHPGALRYFKEAHLSQLFD